MPTRPDRPARRAAALAAAALAAAAVTLTSPSAAAAPPDVRLPPQGLYEGCAPEAGDACIERLAAIRAAGFRYVLNYSSWYGSPVAVRRYADAAAALGLRLIWPLNNPAWRGLDDLGATYSGFAAETGKLEPPGAGLPGAAPGDAEFIARAIGVAAGLPATWGFYIGDELPRAEAGRVRRLSEAVRALAPDKPQLYIARPGMARLGPFARLADVAGADAYPVGSSDPSVRRAAQSARTVTAAAGVRTAMVLQAFSWSQYRPDPGLGTAGFPNRRELTAMRNAAIRNANPTMILWYSYQDILRSDDPSGRWRALTNAAFSSLLSPVRQTSQAPIGLPSSSSALSVVAPLITPSGATQGFATNVQIALDLT
jgi:hypothetical protein